MKPDLLNKKKAATDSPIHPIIKNRWSPRSFSDKQIAPEMLQQLFDAARWAPSSFNEQPWRFIYATKENKQEYDTISQVLNGRNAEWAIGAPVLILTFVKEYFERNGKPNRVAEHDLGAAMSYLTFEATANDLYVHQMAGILPDKALELYNIPDGFKPYTMAAIGYLGDPDHLPEKFQKSETGPRNRLGIDEIVFKGYWG